MTQSSTSSDSNADRQDKGTGGQLKASDSGSNTVLVAVLAGLVLLLCVALVVLVIVLRRRKKGELDDNQKQLAYHNQQF